MGLVLIGASHHDVTLDELARLTNASDDLAKCLTMQSDNIAGAVVLATCNRFEVYLDLNRFHDSVEQTTAFIAELSGLDLDFVVEAMRVVVGNAVAQHLFSVASGLESMVIGEDEIAGQVRGALSAARLHGTTTPALERLMQRALATSKSVTNSTGLGAAGRSIVSVGLDLVEKRFGSVEGRTALIAGTGSYARVVTAALQRRGCTNILVYSSSGRAGQFALSHDLVAVEDLSVALAQADIVAACSGSQDVLIDAEMIKASREDASAVLPIIDLALSPDVAPEVRAMSQAEVIDLEDIRAFAPREHSAAIIDAHAIVLKGVTEFELAESGRAADPAVVAMRRHVTSIINDEIDRTRRRLGDEAADEVARSLHRVSNALLHTPSVRAQELARTGDLEDYAKAMHTLFGIDVDLAVE